MIRDVVGAVLVGGESRRMGRDKARLALDGVTLAARALELLGAVFADVALVAGAERDYSDLDCLQIRDRFAGTGPLGGLEAARRWAGSRPAFLLACDLPRVDRDVVERLLADPLSATRKGASAWARVAARAGRKQPLCGLYSPGCGRVAAKLIRAGRHSLHDLLTLVDLELVSFDGSSPDPFLNVNTPADYEAAGGALAACR